MTMPGMRPILDPEADIAWLAAARVPPQPLGSVVCEEIHYADVAGGTFGIEISVRAWPAIGAEPAIPFPVRADLGSRIAALIRADCEAGG